MLYVATFKSTLDMTKIRGEKIPVADRHKFPAIHVGIEDVFSTYIPIEIPGLTADWLQAEAIRRIEEYMQVVPEDPQHRELEDGDFLLLGPVRSVDHYEDYSPHRWFKSVDHKLIPVDPTTETIDF